MFSCTICGGKVTLWGGLNQSGDRLCKSCLEERLKQEERTRQERLALIGGESACPLLRLEEIIVQPYFGNLLIEEIHLFPSALVFVVLSNAAYHGNLGQLAGAALGGVVGGLAVSFMDGACLADAKRKARKKKGSSAYRFIKDSRFKIAFIQKGDISSIEACKNKGLIRVNHVNGVLEFLSPDQDGSAASLQRWWKET